MRDLLYDLASGLTICVFIAVTIVWAARLAGVSP